MSRLFGVLFWTTHDGDLAIVPCANASDMLKLAPGILVTNEGGEGHADSLIIRGFGTVMMFLPNSSAMPSLKARP